MAKAKEKVVVAKKANVDREMVLAELEVIRQRNDGLLRAEDVVDFARHPDTQLHTKFTWDDTVAAERFRLMQARQVIRVHVKIYPKEKQRVRAYVSMLEDRRKGGGYRSTEEVLAIEAMRDQLLYQAHREMKAFVARYEHLEELAGVIAAIDGALVAVDPTAG